MGVGDPATEEEISDLAWDFHDGGDGGTCTRRGGAQYQRGFRQGHSQFPSARRFASPTGVVNAEGYSRGGCQGGGDGGF